MTSSDKRSRAKNRVNMFRDTDWIESEADFVDEVILHVGKRKDSNRSLTDSFSREFVLFLARPELQRQLPPLVTPEDRVEFAGKFFMGLRLPQEVLQSKLGEISELFEHLCVTVFVVHKK